MTIARRIAGRWCRSKADVDDIAQEAVIRFLRTDPPPYNATGWLLVVIRRLTHRHSLREEARSRAEMSYERSRIRALDPCHLPLDVVTVLARLSERERRLMRLVLEGATSGDIATHLGCQVRDVGTMVARARRKARRLYDQRRSALNGGD